MNDTTKEKAAKLRRFALEALVKVPPGKPCPVTIELPNGKLSFDLYELAFDLVVVMRDWHQREMKGPKDE